MEVSGAQFYAMPPQAVRGRAGGTAIYGMHYFEVSWWVLTALTSLFPLLWASGYVGWRLRERRARRLRDGICLKCGYDLRASVGRCPECGTPVPGGAGADNSAKDGGASIVGGKAGAVDRTGLADLDVARVDFSGVLLRALNAGRDAGERLEAGGGDRLAAEGAEFMGLVFVLAAHWGTSVFSP